mgnify:CR=1 FL=1
MGEVFKAQLQVNIGFPFQGAQSCFYVVPFLQQLQDDVYPDETVPPVTNTVFPVVSGFSICYRFFTTQISS